MEPERFEAISRIFHAALKFDVERQLEFVRQACGSDESLYREIESLLAFQRNTRTFIDQPALEMAAHLLAKEFADARSGRLPARVARYRVGGAVGEGGVQCQKCDGTSTPGARFCSNCGAPIETMQDTVGDPLREALESATGFQYRIERLLGRGGMGAVYLAHELALNRDVAIKVLPPEHAGAPQSRERFLREARTAARLNHANIVPLYTFGEVNGLMYFVMGYVAGESLASKVRRDGPLASDDARTLFAELADALAYAHRHGVIHRDIKPDNILIDADSGSPRLTDFGIAKATFTDTLLTAAGQLIGTPAYMSPEQVRGQLEVDGRSDIYSLGVVAYEVLSGRLPFDAESPMEMMMQRLTQEPRPLDALAPNVAADLIVAIQRCLQPDPANRWPDAQSLRFELVPMDDDADALAVRLLRFSALATSLLAPTFVSATIFARFNSGPIRVLAVTLAFGFIALLFLGFGAAMVLRRQGCSSHAIFQMTLRQPRSWKFWYPRRFRRLGDVWDRLPAHMRRFRLHFALIFGYIWGIYVPLFLGLRLSRTLPMMQLTLVIVSSALVLLAGIERHRISRRLAATLGISLPDVAKIMSTPSWRTAAWQREPAASLLRCVSSAPIPPSVRAPAQGSAFLEQACSGDEALRSEVEQFLDAHDATRTVVDLATTPLADSSARDRPATLLKGLRIGSYTIVREIGHGGMGNVYLAERSIGQIRQSVALKIMRPGLADTPAMIRRFEREREILASFDHPNIARLIDIGATEDGLPYLVMDYVDGEAIDVYCDRRKLNITRRLELFRTVCGALEYAHERGVVHRDLKPANILVKSDADVKLLDFGIAGALNEEGQPTRLTVTNLRPMTIQYASPEQVRGECIGVPSDVYSLGIVLYELLTGHHPYRMESRMIHEWVRIICEEPAVRPSVAVTQTETRTTSTGVITITPERVSESRSEHVSRLRRILTGDLDSILDKALRKNADWRYASAEAFSQDIQRHLTGLPVTAHNGSWTYRFQKIVRRIVYPASGVIHHNAPMFLTWGFFGALIFARKQAIAVGFRHGYKTSDMLPPLIVSVIVSINGAKRVNAEGYASPLDRMAARVLIVTACILSILSVLGSLTGTVPEPAMSLFWTAGLATALLIIGLQASAVLTAGGLLLLGAIVPAVLHPRWLYGWLSAGMLVGIAGAGGVFLIRAARRQE